MIPDSSSGGINPLDPQSWNKYSYVQNRPLSFVDGNGKWATPAHGDIVSTALQGYVNPGMLSELIARQAIMDKNFDLWGNEAFKHAMRGPGQSNADANQKMNEFVSSKMGTHSVSDFGDALHTIQDYTAPLHRDASFQPKEWGGATIARVGLSHLLSESPSSDWSRFGLAVRMSMYAFMTWDPTAAKQRGLTESSFMGEYSKRISDYVGSYYLGLLSEMLGADPLNRSSIEHTIQTESEAARLCAMGAPAACVR